MVLNKEDGIGEGQGLPEPCSPCLPRSGQLEPLRIGLALLSFFRVAIVLEDTMLFLKVTHC